MNNLSKEAINSIGVEHIEKFNKMAFPTIDFKFFQRNQKNEIEIIPEDALFYWCVLSKRIEISKIFWRLGKVTQTFLNSFQKSKTDFI